MFHRKLPDLFGCKTTQLANTVCCPGDAILHDMPGAIMENFVLAKTAGNTLCTPGIGTIHDLEV
jgi:hypothetical protein